MEITTKEQAETILNANYPVVIMSREMTPKEKEIQQKAKEKREPAHLFLLKGKSLKTIRSRFNDGNFKAVTAGGDYLISIQNGQQQCLLVNGAGPANANHRIKSISRF